MPSSSSAPSFSSSSSRSRGSGASSRWPKAAEAEATRVQAVPQEGKDSWKVNNSEDKDDQD
jgi:hypothetical protein